MFEQKMIFYKLLSSFKIRGAIKGDLVGYFWAIHVGNRHTNFQVSNSTDVGGEWGYILKEGHPAVFGPIPVTKILNS